MDREDRSSGGVPGGGLLVIALLAVGAFVATKPPLESARPTEGQLAVERRVAAQDADARLWQDPFGAVRKARERSLKSAADVHEDRRRHSEAFFREEVERRAREAGAGGVFVMPVMVFGGPYAEQIENRRRMRYAVLAGLQSRGFYPSDNEHLGYFYPNGGDGPAHGLPETIPFETFERKRGQGRSRGDRTETCDRCRVVVLWLDAVPFGLQPLHKLASLARSLAPAGAQGSNGAPALRVRWRVIGPASSDHLRVLIEEAAQPDFDEQTAPALKQFDFRFLSSGATAPDDALLDNIDGGSAVVEAKDACSASGWTIQTAKPVRTVSDYLQQRGVTLVRTIGTDDLLARALKEELVRRGLQLSGECRNDGVRETRSPGSSIAIIAEGDTLYGRGLRQQFRADGASREPGFDVERWTYFRGIDGRLPGDSAAQGSDGRGRKDPKAESAEPQDWYSGYTERPEGTGQGDYLRRQAALIRADHARRMREHGPKQGLRAVGVLGTDAYDKLLVLQATQPEVPQALFFTTDLDSRLFHPREQRWARNLIVASSFGLALTNDLQRGVAPFRDSYQTAAFLATLMMVQDIRAATANPDAGPVWKQERVNAWFATPRLFEIARNGAFDFSERTPQPQAPVDPLLYAELGRAVQSDAVAAGTAIERCTPRDLLACQDIHPAAPALWPQWSGVPVGLSVALLTAVLSMPALLLSRGLRRRLRRYVGSRSPEVRLPRRAALWALLLALFAGLATLVASSWPAIGAWLTQAGEGKPLSIVLGISPWPTYALRLLALVLGVYFVWYAWVSLSASINRIAREFRLGSTRRRLDAAIGERERRLTCSQRLWAMFEVRFFREGLIRERLTRTRLTGERLTRERLTREGPTSAADATTGMSAQVDNFWMHYIVQNRLGARALRAAACVLVMVLVCMATWQAMGDYAPAPQRGSLTGWMHFATLISGGLATLFVLFFVADAALLCVLFMRGLRLQTASWPDATLRVFESRLGLDRCYLDDWIDLEFIARRTRCVAALIYYPFIVLSLLILARSSFFDDWYAPAALYVVTGASAAIVLACAFALRRSAEASRRHALVRIRDAILRARGKSDAGNLVSQLEALRERMERLREGAFAPYSQQPLLKAILLPVLTIGGTSLFDYLTLANL